MNTILANLWGIVLFPTALVAGFFSLVQLLVHRTGFTTPLSPRRTAFVAVAVGLYFLGHPLYPSLVPLIRDVTTWVFTVGGAYATVGVLVLVLDAYDRTSETALWTVGLLASGGAAVTVVGLWYAAYGDVPYSDSVLQALLMALPLAAMLPTSYQIHRSEGRRTVVGIALVFLLYALFIVNTIPITERVRGPAALVFVAFGSIGVVLGIPLAGLGAAMSAGENEDRQTQRGNSRTREALDS